MSVNATYDLLLKKVHADVYVEFPNGIKNAPRITVPPSTFYWTRRIGRSPGRSSCHSMSISLWNSMSMIRMGTRESPSTKIQCPPDSG